MIFYVSYADEHVMIELFQTNGSTPIPLADYETSAKEFLYPYSSARLEYDGLPRALILNPTRNFPGALSPSIEITLSTSIDEMPGRRAISKTYRGKTSTNASGKNVKSSLPSLM
jgi:hypothetical protein